MQIACTDGDREEHTPKRKTMRTLSRVLLALLPLMTQTVSAQAKQTNTPADGFIRIAPGGSGFTLDGKRPSISSTGIEDSVCGHLMGFCADRAMEEHRAVEVDFDAWR